MRFFYKSKINICVYKKNRDIFILRIVTHYFVHKDHEKHLKTVHENKNRKRVPFGIYLTH